MRLPLGGTSGSTALAGLTVAALFTLSACTSGSDNSDDAARTSVGSSTDSSAKSEAVAPGADAGMGDTSTIAQADVLTERSEIVTADVTLVDKDLGKVRDRIDSLLVGYGGAVADEATYNRAGGTTRESHLTLRVPEDNLGALVRDFRSFTTVKESHKTSKDVTTQVIDLDSRVKSKQAALDRLRTFLSQTTNVDTLIKIEAEVSNREAELESLLAQQKYLDDQVTMATLSVSLMTPPVAAKKASEAGFADGLANGWDAFKSSARVAATVVGAVLPFALLLALIGAVAWMVRARTTARTR